MPTTAIPIGSDGTAATATVRNGYKVQWQAPSDSSAWVNPPDIFKGGCATGHIIKLAPDETGPEPACVVSHQPGTFGYGCGVGNPPLPPPITDGGEIIIVNGLEHPPKKY